MITLSKDQYLGQCRRGMRMENFSINEVIYTNTVSEDWHFHENAHVCLALTGGNREYRQKKQQEVTAGTMLFYCRGELHRNTNTRFPSKNINLEIEPHWFSRHDIEEATVEQSVKDGSFRFFVLKMYKEMLTSDNYSSVSIELLLHQALCNSRKLSTEKSSRIHKVREILHDQPDKTISLQELSACTGINPINISRYFPKYFQCTLGQYMRKLKIEQALQLIPDKKKSLTDIAYQCGFSDQSHFIRTFKAETGFLPNQYRKLL